MYDHIQGEVALCKPNLIVISTGGVGYAIKVSLNTYSAAKPHPQIVLHTYLSVSETAMVLYGFWAVREREVFLALISVTGVGPNTALNILSYMDHYEVEHAAAHENKAAFRAVKGIGEKLAAQIVLDLKGKFKAQEEDAIAMVNAGWSSASIILDEAVSGLMSMGYNKTDAKKLATKAVEAGETTLEDIIKHSLKNIK